MNVNQKFSILDGFRGLCASNASDARVARTLAQAARAYPMLAFELMATARQLRPGDEVRGTCALMVHARFVNAWGLNVLAAAEKDHLTPGDSPGAK